MVHKEVIKNNIGINTEISLLSQLRFHGIKVFVFQSVDNPIRHGCIHDIPYNNIVILRVYPSFFGVPYY